MPKEYSKHSYPKEYTINLIQSTLYSNHFNNKNEDFLPQHTFCTLGAPCWLQDAHLRDTQMLRLVISFCGWSSINRNLHPMDVFSKSLSTLLTCCTECRESPLFHLAFVRFIPVQVTLTPAVVSWHALPICMLWLKAKAIRSWTLDRRLWLGKSASCFCPWWFALKLT